MKSFLFSLLALGLLLGSSGCWDIQKGQPFQHIAPGAWRGVFVFDQEAPTKLMKVKKDSVRDERVPVLFEVASDAKGMPQRLRFLNGADTLDSDSLRFWGDTLYVYFQPRETYMRLVFEINLMEGLLYDQRDEQYPLRFQAQAGPYPRYPDIRRAPLADVSGIWAAQLADVQSDTMLTVQMQFKAQNNDIQLVIAESPFAPKLNLAGTIQGKQLYLSGFDGKLAAQVAAELSADGRSLQKASLRINNQLYNFVAQR